MHRYDFSGACAEKFYIKFCGLALLFDSMQTEKTLLSAEFVSIMFVVYLSGIPTMSSLVITRSLKQLV